MAALSPVTSFMSAWTAFASLRRAGSSMAFRNFVTLAWVFVVFG
jgi:hypothetical protein